MPFANISQEEEIDRRSCEWKAVWLNFLAKCVRCQYLRCGCRARTNSWEPVLSIRDWISRSHGNADRRVSMRELAALFDRLQICELTDWVIELL